MKLSRTHSGARWILPMLFLAAVAASGPAALGETLERQIAVPYLSPQPDATGRWTEIAIPGAELGVPLGAPAVPGFRVLLPLAPGAHVQSVAWQPGETQTLSLTLPVLPYAGEQAIEQTVAPLPRADAAIYAGAALYPAEAARLANVFELSDGARYAVVWVYPVRVRPSTNEIAWTKQGRLVVTLGAAPTEGGLVRERAALPAAAAPVPGGTVLLAEHGLAPATMPSAEGSPVLYAIIAPPDAAIADAWQPLADWKTAQGYPAEVFRTDWIDEHYPAGADQPERIRDFLRDAYLHWGLRWALIGADASFVPTRYALSRAYSDPGTEIATDYYYACLEGNWDADGDGVFGESARATQGEVGDFVDFTPEIEVGRVSARSAADVQGFLAKYFSYTRTPPADGYLDRGLFLGEVLFSAEWSRTGNHGGFDCEEDNCSTGSCRVDSEGKLVCVSMDGAADAITVGDQIHDELGVPLERQYILERFEHWNADAAHPGLNAMLENTANVMSAMSAGYGMVHHVGHGDRDRWAVGDGRIEITRLSSLTNGAAHHYFWTYGVNCNSAAIDFDSFGERLVLMPTNGAIGYIGCTNADFPTVARLFSRDFYEFIFGTPGSTFGDGHFGAAAANALTGDAINHESTTRFLLYTQILLGDPGMPIWPGTPSPMTASIVGSPSGDVPISQSSISIAVTSDRGPVAGARVCLQKEGEIYLVALTGADGIASDVQFWPRTQSSFTVTVTAPSHVPTAFTGNVTSASGAPALTFEGLGIVDDGTDGSVGNGDGRIEVGETIRLPLTIRNAGDASASNVQATLALGADAPAGCATVTDADASLGTIPSQGSATDPVAFLVTYAYAPPPEVFGDADLVRVPLRLTLTSSAGTATLDLFLELSRARIATAVNRLADAGSGYKKLWMGILNKGQGTASNLLGKLTTQDPFKISVLTTGAIGVRDVAPGDTALVGPFRIRITNDLGKLDFFLMDSAPTPDDTLQTRTMDLRAPLGPDSLQLVGLPAAMEVRWKPAHDAGTDSILGYRVYRKLADQSTFEPVTESILEEHRYITDAGLGQLTRYSYYVAAIDAGGNLGAQSQIVSAYTSPGPSEGWPHFTQEFTKSSPTICELDGATTRGREILFGADCVYAFHGDGTEMNDGDRLERTSGPFGVVGEGRPAYPFWGKPAAGDIDGDGDVEVLAISFMNTSTTPEPEARGALYCWGTWGGDPEWVYTFPEKWTSWTCPVLADLNGDGRMEVIFSGGRTDHAGIYVLKHDGTPFSPGGALLKDCLGTNLFQSPAVGDVDGDGTPEIVIATRTSVESEGALWVLRPNGTPLPRFNDLKFSTLGLAQLTTGSPTLCNVNGIAGDEIFIVTTKRIWCFTNADTQVLWYKDFSSEFSIRTVELLPEPALGDIDGDGQPEIALVDPVGKLIVYSASGGAVELGFPVQLDATRHYGSCILANVDLDPKPEIIFGDNKQLVYAYRFNGQIAAGFPYTFGGEMMRQSPAAWDVDHDGYQNLVLQANSQQEVTVLNMAGVAFPTTDPQITQQNPWPMRRRDPRNTGELTLVSPVMSRIRVDELDVSPAGAVTLVWSSAEAAASYRIRRALGEESAGVLVAEVPATSGGEEQSYRYVDTPSEPGSYVYHVNAVLLDGSEQPGPMIHANVTWDASPIRFGLQRVSPDPFLPDGRVAAISFGIPGPPSAQVRARLAVYDVQGRRLRVLLDEPRPAGVHVVSWDGRDEGGRAVPAGLYLLRLQAQGASSERRVLVVR